MKRNKYLLAGIAMLALGMIAMLPSVCLAAPRGGYHGSYHGGYYHGGYHYGGFYRGGYYPFYRGYGYVYPGFGYYPGYYGVYVPSYSAYYDVPYYPRTTVIYSSSAYAPSPAPAPAEDRAYLTIQLPVDKGEIWIEGVKSVQEKSLQQYVSPPLESGKKYNYEVRARWIDPQGKAIEAKRSFPIYAGKPVLVDFTQGPAPAEKQ